MAINASNEITTLGTPDSSEAAAFIADTFNSSINSFWTQDTGTWTISSGKVKTTNQGAGILLASADVYVANYSLKVTVPVDQGDAYAGLVIAHDGNDTYYAAVFNATFGLKSFDCDISPDFGRGYATRIQLSRRSDVARGSLRPLRNRRMNRGRAFPLGVTSRKPCF